MPLITSRLTPLCRLSSETDQSRARRRAVISQAMSAPISAVLSGGISGNPLRHRANTGPGMTNLGLPELSTKMDRPAPVQRGWSDAISTSDKGCLGGIHLAGFAISVPLQTAGQGG